MDINIYIYILCITGAEKFKYFPFYLTVHTICSIHIIIVIPRRDSIVLNRRSKTTKRYIITSDYLSIL